jgi:hypothetical protein
MKERCNCSFFIITKACSVHSFDTAYRLGKRISKRWNKIGRVYAIYLSGLFHNSEGSDRSRSMTIKVLFVGRSGSTESLPFTRSRISLPTKKIYLSAHRLSIQKVASIQHPPHLPSRFRRKARKRGFCEKYPIRSLPSPLSLGSDSRLRTSRSIIEPLDFFKPFPTIMISSDRSYRRPGRLEFCPLKGLIENGNSIPP